MIRLWRAWRDRRRTRKNCFHHDRVTGTSWISSQLIDLGSRKLFWCTTCERTWIP